VALEDGSLKRVADFEGVAEASGLPRRGGGVTLTPALSLEAEGQGEGGFPKFTNEVQYLIGVLPWNENMLSS